MQNFVLYGNRTILLFKRFVSASLLHVLLLSLCHPAIVLVLFVVRRSFVLSFSLHIRPCSLLPLLPLFFACCCCFFCASPSSFCFPCFSLLFVRALCLFSVAFCFIVQSQKACYISNSSTKGKDITKTCTGKIKACDLVVQGLGQPLPPPLLLQAAVDRHHRQHPRHTKKNTRSSEPPTTKSRSSRARPSRTPSRTFKVRRILLSL